MQYTDNEAAFQLLSSSGCIRRTEGFLYPRAGASAHRPGVCRRSQAGSESAGIFDADLSDVQRGPARPDGRQPEDDGAAKFLPLIAKTTNRQKCCRLTFRQHFFYTEKSAPKGAPRR